MALLISGSLVYDNIMNFPDSFKNHIMPEQIHVLNVSFAVDRLEKSLGGTAGNIAYSVKLLGGDPILLSVLGKDGEDYLKHWKKVGIDSKQVVLDTKQMTASCYITTDADDNQITAFFGGPLSMAKDIDLKNLGDRPGLAIISPTNKDVMVKHLRQCKDAGIKAIFDPGQQMTSFTGEELKKMISMSFGVIGNDYEIKLLEERTGWDGKEILRNTEILITTLGERGSVVATADGELVETAVCPPQSFDDPTGAGDAYRAGFFTGYEMGYNWRICARMGSVAASYAIETFGTQAHDFSKQEFCVRYEKAYAEKISLER
ncbi:MAG: carbohydrate kinase family protein [bacterium]|nr:carbohydrate kinase family protein [bacterium]